MSGLTTASSQPVTNPGWGRGFWSWVSELEARSLLSPGVKQVLQAHGYAGPGSVTTPSTEALRKQLEELLAGNLPRAGASFAGASGWVVSADDQYSAALPVDLRRAAPEIYRAIRSEGVASVRAWLNSNFQGYRGQGSQQWIDLWNLATQIDMTLATCRSDQEILLRLSTDDVLESSLRHISAYLYEKRTGDHAGASHMRAFATPGTARDIAPSWLVSDSTLYSKQETQRADRVDAEVRRRNKDRGNKGDGKKGKPADGGKGKKGSG